jgi:hypothetical protein
VDAPDWTVIESAVTSAAIVVGGLWAGWKWGYGETLRKRRELPDLDGTLTATSVPLPGGKAYLTLQAVWRNPGPGPIMVRPDHSFVEQYELGTDPPLGSFRVAGHPGLTKISTAPWRYRGYAMGPLTESVLTEHFVVPAGSVYAFTWQICQGRQPRGRRDHALCDRELIWSSLQAETARPAANRPPAFRPRRSKRPTAAQAGRPARGATDRAATIRGSPI